MAAKCGLPGFRSHARRLRREARFGMFLLPPTENLFEAVA